MTIGKTIAFSLLLHTLCLTSALLSARYIVSEEKTLLVSLLVDSGPEKNEEKGVGPSEAPAAVEKVVKKKRAVILPRKKAESPPADTTHIESTQHAPETGGPLPEKKEKDSGGPVHQTQSGLVSQTNDGLAETKETSGHGSGESLSLSFGGSGRSSASGKGSGETVVEFYPGGNGSGSQSLLGQIRASIERALIYPPLARKRKQEGTVIAEFSIGSKGRPRNIRITKSSGYGLLDSAARDTIVKAAPFPDVKGTIEVPVRFSLKD